MVLHEKEFPDDEIAFFECQQCGAIIKVNQSKYDETKPIRPVVCDEQQGGCGRVGKFLKLSDEWMRRLQKKRDDRKE